MVELRSSLTHQAIAESQLIQCKSINPYWSKVAAGGDGENNSPPAHHGPNSTRCPWASFLVHSVDCIKATLFFCLAWWVMWFSGKYLNCVMIIDRKCFPYLGLFENKLGIARLFLAAELKKRHKQTKGRHRLILCFGLVLIDPSEFRVPV